MDDEVEVPLAEVPADEPEDDDPPLEPLPDAGTPEDGVAAALFDETDPSAETAAGTEP